MVSHYSTIGMPLASEEDVNALIQRVFTVGERVAAPIGEYRRWSDPSGAEAWLQLGAKNEFMGMNPHYAGRSAVTVGLTARLASAGPSELDGSFHGWADPAGEAPDSGCYPFVFDTPDYRLHDGLPLPARTQVQIAAFAHEISAFETVAAFEASQTGELKYGSQSFIPSGLFRPTDDSSAPPPALAMFAGHVLAAEKKINGLTNRAFYWALAETYGGAYDVVIDPDLLSGAPAVGGVISGSFWLSGRIIRPTSTRKGIIKGGDLPGRLLRRVLQPWRRAYAV
jgi:hypothetical protein